MKFEEKIPLIVFYSRTGNNWYNGEIRNLTVGNTAIIAELIKQVTKGDIFEIKPLEPYPSEYHETTEVAKKELNDNARPRFEGNVSDIDKYDIIFLGGPNWWGTFPMVISTFIESHELTGKTIIPFITHEGSGLGRCVKDLKKICPNSDIIGAKAFLGSTVKDQDQNVEKWIQNLK